MAVTINDVAKLAGVSHTTVSWVIHDDPRITDKTKAKVMKAVKELDYHPNYMARSLVKGKTNIIAVVAPFFSSSFEMDILRGIEDGIENSSSQYNLNMYSTRDEHTRTLEQILHGRRADAVILLTIKPEDSVIAQYNKNSIPLILIEEEAENTHVVRTNNIKGAYISVNSLIKDSGRKKIALVVEELEPGLSQVDRTTGYRKALEENNIPFDEKLVIGINKFRFEEGQEIFPKILESGADAVFCASGDMIAMGILLEARNRHIKVPRQLAVVGFDDSQMCNLVYPTLSTVRQPLALMGKKAWEIATSTEKRDGFEHVIFEPEYIVRDSV
jgi:LacI family transcriptional regulator, galactose operon repressor